MSEKDTWERVSPRYVVVEVTGALITGLVICAVCLVPILAGWRMGWWPWLVGAGAVAWTILYLLLTPRRVRAIGFQLREDDLLFRRGLLVRRVVAVPYGRMQLVDSVRGPMSRALGLADLKFVTAAAATAVSIPGLPAERAEKLRDQLVALAETRRAGL